MSFLFLLTCMLAFVVHTHVQAIDLGAAASYGLIAGVAITNIGPTVINGNIAVFPGTSINGFPPGTVTGSIRSAGDATAQNAAISAYNQGRALTCNTNLLGGTVVGGTVVLTPGVYCFGGSTTLGGRLILDAQGDPNAQFVIKVTGDFTAASTSTVLATNGAQTCGIFFIVSGSATLGLGAAFAGNLIAQQSITSAFIASSQGGLYSLTGSVSLSTNTITAAGSCAVPPAVTTTTTTTTTSSTSSTTTKPTTLMACNADNCLRAFRATQTLTRLSAAQVYCSTYTQTTVHGATPTWVPAECTAKRISSVCSCIAATTTTTMAASSVV